MAFVRDRDDEQRLQEAENPELSKAGGGSFTGGGGPGTAVNKSAGRGSGQFTNLQQYMEVNKPQAEAFVDRTTGGLRSGVEGTQKYIQDEELGGFQKDVSSGTVQDDAELRGMNARDMNDEQKAKYSSALTGKYTGPKDFVSNQGFNQLDTQNQQIQNSDSFEGKQQIAKDMYGADRPRYTRGEQTLDTLFLNQPKDSREKFGGLRDWAGGAVESTKADTLSKASKYVTDAVTTSDAASQGFQTDLASDLTSLDAEIAAATTALNEQRQQDYQNAYNAQVAGIPEALDDWSQMIYNQNPEAYGRGGFATYGGDVDAYSAITDDQLAESNALSQLGGTTDKYLGGRQIAPDAYTFDDAKYQQSIQDNRSAGTQAQENFHNVSRNQESLATPKMQELYNKVGQVGYEAANPEIEATYNEIKNKPMPSNPMGYSTYGEYMASEFGIKTGEAYLGHLAEKNGWQRSTTFDTANEDDRSTNIITSGTGD